MTEALDLRRSFLTVRRHLRIFCAVVLLGVLIGVAYALVAPVTLTSTALVVLPQAAAQEAAAAAATGAASTDLIDTQAVIAGSDPVLSAALPHARPAGLSLPALQKKVTVTSLADSVIQVTGSGTTAADAEATANAVADSYVAYVTGPHSPVGQVDAKLLQAAVTATGTSLAERAAVDAVLGLVGGALVGYVVALAVGRGDRRRLSERDRMANSLGVPVIGSFPVARPADVAGWSKLLAEYAPDPAVAQRLRAVLASSGVTEKAAPPAGGGAAQKAGPPAGGGAVPSVTILSFGADPAALAAGPQLASFAAAEGIPTTLVIGPGQESQAATALRAAGLAAPVPRRRKRLRVVVSDGGDVPVPRGARLVVAVAVVDSQRPRLPGSVRTAASAVAISPGVVTAAQLRRGAAAATADGRELLGILVANPAPDDQTTGRRPRLGQPLQRPLPTQV